MTKSRQRVTKTLPWLVLLSVSLLLIGLYFMLPSFHDFINEAFRVLTSGDRQRIERWVQGFGAWGPIVILFAMLLQVVVAVVPSILLMTVAVLAYGPVQGGLLAWVGVLLAAIFGYGVGRLLGPVTVERLLGQETVEKLEHTVTRYGVWAVVAARISPVLSTDAISFVAGILKMRFIPYLVASALGIAPLAALIAYLGTSINQLAIGLGVISVLSIVGIVAYAVYDQARQRRKSQG